MSGECEIFPFPHFSQGNETSMFNFLLFNVSHSQANNNVYLATSLYCYCIIFTIHSQDCPKLRIDFILMVNTSNPRLSLGLRGEHFLPGGIIEETNTLTTNYFNGDALETSIDSWDLVRLWHWKILDIDRVVNVFRCSGLE